MLNLVFIVSYPVTAHLQEESGFIFSLSCYKEDVKSSKTS